MSEREREKTEQTQQPRRPRDRSLKLWDDTSAEERYYSRSVKIRCATLEFMGGLADLSEQGRPVPWGTMEDLADYAANYVETSGWDRKPASALTARRWASQYLRGNSFFKPQSMGQGSFMVSWRGGEETKLRVQRILREFKRKP